MLLSEMMSKYDTVHRGNCRDCGNPWWFSMENCFVCTMCGKAHGRSFDEPYVAKNKESK